MPETTWSSQSFVEPTGRPAAAFPFSRALFAIERADIDFLVSFVALFIMVTMGFWLVRAFGPLGAALGFLTANFITCAVKAVAFLRLPENIPRDRTTR